MPKPGGPDRAIEWGTFTPDRFGYIRSAFSHTLSIDAQRPYPNGTLSHLKLRDGPSTVVFMEPAGIGPELIQLTGFNTV